MSEDAFPAMEVSQAALACCSVNKGPNAMPSLMLIISVPAEILWRTALVAAFIALIFLQGWCRVFVQGVMLHCTTLSPGPPKGNPINIFVANGDV